MASRDTVRRTAEPTDAPRGAEARRDVVLRTARQVAHHERGKLALLHPVAWLATLHTTAWAADTIDAHPLLRAGVIAATAVAVLGRAERRGQDLPVVPVTAGVLWAAGASVFGPYGWVAILLWVAGILLAVPYWVGVLRRPRRQPRAVPVERDTVRLSAQARLWQCCWRSASASARRRFISISISSHLKIQAHDTYRTLLHPWPMSCIERPSC